MNGYGQKKHETLDFVSEQGEHRLFSSSPRPSVEAFRAICNQQATLDQYPLAESIVENVPIYRLLPYSTLTEEQRLALQEEWYRVLLRGPGVFVTSGLFHDMELIDGVTDTFHHIIDEEKKTAKASGDHFAGVGTNDRIWNSFSKHGIADPVSFLKYYSNPYLSLISSAWLGPGYRITAQVNNVKPGGQPQVSHRDYHLGFMTSESCSQYPRALQIASQCLTLQGAVAHVDVPVESGPTRLLPFSQMFSPGYVAYRLPEFDEFFLKNYVSLPLEKGDGIFFNPALFHAAGKNESSDIDRLVNLLQISSAFGKPMEAIDAIPIIESTWDELVALYKEKGLSDEVRSLVAAVGEGYPFPNNLDNNAPKASDMSPDTEQDIILKSLIAGHGKAEALDALKSYRASAQP
ncbi:hypothetical protein TRVA0_089S00188 [Trichomonascus vanleenenianus]|uniref:uncharacterized protein n=1 Tax=Trichomonascus vanleenenianus TaxID=2268995 RepID=UPI003EC9E00F